MNDPLDVLWVSFDTESPVYSGEVVRGWPAGMFDWLIASELIAPSDIASHVACPSCPDRHVEEVLSRAMPDGTAGFFIVCPECYRVAVPADLLRQWRPNYKLLARRVRELLNISGRVSEPIDERLWRLGVAKWAGKPRELYMARGLGWSDGSTLLARCAGQSRPVVLIGLVPPPAELLAARIPTVVPLPSVLSSVDGALGLDHELLAQRIAECDQIVGAKGRGDYPDLRRWVSQCVEKCMSEGPLVGVIAAGVSQGMSTREISADLAKRGMPRHHATVGRIILNAKKGTLLGETAPASASIIKPGSSQPRDRRGKAIPDAQPKEG